LFGVDAGVYPPIGWVDP